MSSRFPDLTDDEVYKQHARFLIKCANAILKPQCRQFIIDSMNEPVIRFLLYYFNRCSLCESVFPDKEYSLGKQILLYGKPGVGKTFLMDVFALYLKKTNNPNSFVNVSLSQMMNHFMLNENIDKFTFNEIESKTFEGRPYNICMNDIGVQSHKHFGIDPQVLVNEFLYSRNDIYVGTGKMAHITTNLDKTDIKEVFYDEHGRLTDRIFSTYNFIPMKGDSRR